MEKIVFDDGMDRLDRQRQIVLSALDFLYAPLTVEDAAACGDVFADAFDHPSSWDELIAVDRSAWHGSRNGGEVRLCPSWTDGGHKIEPTLLTRSDWPSAARVVLEPLDSHHLWLVRGFCDLFLIAEEEFGDTNLGSLVNSIRWHVEPVAEHLAEATLVDQIINLPSPGAGIIEEIREMADDIYTDLAEREMRSRDTAASTIDSLPTERRLFGGE